MWSCRSCAKSDALPFATPLASYTPTLSRGTLSSRMIATLGCAISELARAIRDGDGDRLTTSGVVVGTVVYMSPEQASIDRNIDARSDIDSLGCVVYESLAGVHPFVAADEARSLAMRMVSDPSPISLH